MATDKRKPWHNTVGKPLWNRALASLSILGRLQLLSEGAGGQRRVLCNLRCKLLLVEDDTSCLDPRPSTTPLVLGISIALSTNARYFAHEGASERGSLSESTLYDSPHDKLENHRGSVQ